MQNTIDQRKPLAVLVILALFVIYVEMVWNPYFLGPRNGSAGQAKDPQTAQQAGLQTTSDPVGNKGAQASSTKYVDTAVPEPVANTLPNSIPQPQSSTTAVSTVPKSNSYPTDAEVEQGGILEIRSPRLSVSLSKLGGRATKIQLAQHAEKTEKGSPRLNLVHHVEYAPYPLGVYSGGVSDAWVKYSLTSATHSPQAQLGAKGALELVNINDGSEATFVFDGQLPDGRSIRKTFKILGRDSHEGNFIEVIVSLGAGAADRSRMELEWSKLVPDNSSSWLDPYNTQGFSWFDGNKAEHMSFQDLESEKKSFGNVRWVTMGDKYFMTSLIPGGGASYARAFRTNDLYRSRVSGGDVNSEFILFFGPKSYRMLQGAGFDLQRNINFGIFGFISAPLLSLLHVFFDLFGNYGLAIIVLTILVKTVLFPLNSTSYRQMKAMGELQPEIKRIRDSVKDKQQQQIELMDLYKKRGVNPFGGCLPMLVQMPIFFGLYSALSMAVELRHAPFMFWIQDLSAPEQLMIAGVGIPVMVILFVLSMLVQQWTTPSAMDPTQKKVMMIMPVVFGFMFMSLPSGLTVYFLTNNLISIAQSKGLQRDKKGSSYAIKLTAAVSVGLFLIAFILTKLS